MASLSMTAQSASDVAPAAWDAQVMRHALADRRFGNNHLTLELQPNRQTVFDTSTTLTYRRI
jgi:hypothetical protein